MKHSILFCCVWFLFAFRAEVELGKIIQKHGWKRTGYVVTIKIYWSMKSEERGLSRKHIIESVKASLQRLQLPYVDVVIIYKADPMCPMEGELFWVFFLPLVFHFALPLYSIISIANIIQMKCVHFKRCAIIIAATRS